MRRWQLVCGVADATPKSGEGEVEMIRMLRSARDSAVARTQAGNQMKALVVTAPAKLRETLDGLTTSALTKRCRNFRPSRLDDPKAYTLRSLACRYRHLSDEVRDLDAEIHPINRPDPGRRLRCGTYHSCNPVGCCRKQL